VDAAECGRARDGEADIEVAPGGESRKRRQQMYVDADQSARALGDSFLEGHEIAK
jgi:hypothetical protein